MVLSVIEFHVKEGREEAFKRCYLKSGLLGRARAASGFIGGEFAMQSGPPVRFLTVACWRTHEDYAAWQAAYHAILPAKELRELSGLLKKPPKSSTFDILDSAAGRDTLLPEQDT